MKTDAVDKGDIWSRETVGEAHHRDSLIYGSRIHEEIAVVKLAGRGKRACNSQLLIVAIVDCLSSSNHKGRRLTEAMVGSLDAAQRLKMGYD